MYGTQLTKSCNTDVFHPHPFLRNDLPSPSIFFHKFYIGLHQKFELFSHREQPFNGGAQFSFPQCTTKTFCQTMKIWLPSRIFIITCHLILPPPKPIYIQILRAIMDTSFTTDPHFERAIQLFAKDLVLRVSRPFSDLLHGLSKTVYDS